MKIGLKNIKKQSSKDFCFAWLELPFENDDLEKYFDYESYGDNLIEKVLQYDESEGIVIIR